MTLITFRRFAIVVTALAGSACNNAGTGAGSTQAVSVPAASAPATSAPAISEKTVVARGVISDLGSNFERVVVNGVEFETAQALVEKSGEAAASTDLALGQSVTVIGHRTDDGRAIADRLSYDPEFQGRITSIDMDHNRFTALGQTVRVGDTAFSGVTDLSELAVDDFVEASGLTGADGLLHATFVKKLEAQALAQVTGRILNLDSNARTFELNQQVVDYASATFVPDTSVLVEGLRVQVKGVTDSAVLVAAAVTDASGLGAAPDAEATVSGMVEQTDTPGSLVVNGVLVNLGDGTAYEGGSAANLNDLIEVQGTMNNQGALDAVRVRFLNRE